jgi:hypothetical protein
MFSLGCIPVKGGDKMKKRMAIHLVIVLVSGVMIFGVGTAASDSACTGCDTGAQDYVRIARQLRQDALTLANSPHEPGAVMIHVGRDPADITEAVEKWVTWQPELGVVRGPAGTLSSGTGGDWDRAALLQAVLETAGYSTRFVVAARSEHERKQVVTKFLAAEGGSLTLKTERRHQSGDPIGTGLLDRYGVPVRNHSILMIEAAARWRRLLDEAYDSGERVTENILRRITDPQMGPPVAFDFSAWQSRLEAAASEAVAVEVETDNGWDLMKLGPDADKIDWRHARSISKVPSERIARLTLGIEMTVLNEDTAVDRIMLLDHSVGLGQLFQRSIRLEIAPDAGDGAQGGAGSWTAGQWHEKVKGFDRFQVVLQVGSEMFSSLVFDMSGQTYQVGRDGRIEGATKIGGAVQRGFGGLSGAPRDAPKKKVMRLETIVLTFEIERPGSATVRRQRLLYGPLRPRATPVFHADILAAGGPVSPASVLWMALDAAIANAAMWTRVVTAADPAQYPGNIAAHMPEMLHEWLLAHSELADRQLFSNPGLTFVSGPAVSMWASQLLHDEKSGQVLARTALDVVWEDSRLGPRRPADVSAAQRANVSLGVASTTFEALLLRERTPPATILTALAGAELLLASEAAQAITGEPSPLAAWGIENNETGRAVFFAGPGPVNTWWSIDPKTGTTIGRGDGGEGQAATEYGNVQKQNLNNLKCFLEALGGGSGGDYVACMTGLDSKTGRIGAAVGLRTQMGGFDNQAKAFGALSQAASILKGIDNSKGLTGAGQ